METQTNTEFSRAETIPAPERVDRIFLENNLLRVMGFLFCHDKRTASRHIDSFTTIEELVKRPITIQPHSSYGQPGPGHFKLFLAIMKKLSDYGRPVPNNVYFSRAEMARLTDRSWGGNTGKQFMQFFLGLASTRITTSFYDRLSDKWEIANFSIPSDFIVSGKGSNVQSCSITIPEIVRRSLQDNFFSCLNYSRIRGVNSIEVAFYIRLFHHFSNLHENGSRNSVQIRKRYDAICSEWLGNLGVRPSRSLIVQQLGPHLDNLVSQSFLRSYSITRTAAGDGFNLTFFPGKTFFEDYDRFYKARMQTEVQFQYHDEQISIGQPLELVRRFHELRTGQKITASHITLGEQQYAAKLTNELGYEDAAAFMEYGVKRARAADYSVNTLSGLKVYFADFLQKREAIDRGREQAAERQEQEREQQAQAAYATFRKRRAEELLAAAAEDLRDEIEATAVARALAKRPSFQGATDRMTIYFERIALIEERIGLPTFEEWRLSISRAQ
jgi:hypothetical protein